MAQYGEDSESQMAPGLLDFLRQLGANARAGEAMPPASAEPAPAAPAALGPVPASTPLASPEPHQVLNNAPYSDMNKGGFKEYFGPASGPIEDGMMVFSRNMPGMPGEGFTSSNSRYGGPAGQEPKPDKNAPRGRWEYAGPDPTEYGITNGDQNPVNPNTQGVWRWRAEEAPAAPTPVEEEQKKVERFPEGDIYNDWDYYQKRARADVEGINRMPFTYADYPNVGQTKADAMQQFYPAAWQEGGVQKVIGPNGTNIAPQLDENLLSIFRDRGIDTATAKDWPSLLDQLLRKGTINTAQRGTLDSFTKRKEPDQSFANQNMAMMARG